MNPLSALTEPLYTGVPPLNTAMRNTHQHIASQLKKNTGFYKSKRPAPDTWISCLTHRFAAQRQAF